MDAHAVNEMLAGINLVHFLNWSGNTLQKKDGKTLFVCPFNKEKRTTCIASELGRPCAAHADEKDFVLTVDVKAKILSCALCGEKNTWNIVDYVKKLHNYQNGDAYQHLLAYWQEARTLQKEPYTIIARTRQKIVLRIDDRTYTLTDVKFKKLHDFSMTIMLEHGSTPPLFCEVNLTGGKRREEFVSEAKAHFSFSEEIIQSDITILQQAVRDLQEEYSQKQQDEIQSAKKKFEPTDTETTEAMKTLREKELVFDELMRDMEAIGFTGDEIVKAILFLACVSRMLARPLCVLILAGSGGGKSHAIEIIAQCFPDEEVHDLTGMSSQSLPNYDPYALCRHILISDEIYGLEESIMYYLRSFISKGKITRSVSLQDKTTGRFHTVEKTIHGPIVFLTSATSAELIHDETMNRMFVLSSDEQTEQTRNVMRAMFRRRTKSGIMHAKKQEKIFRKYKAIARCLRPLSPIIPEEWMEKLLFNSEKLYHKRQFDGYLTLIEALALTRQYQCKTFMLKDADGNLVESFRVRAREVRDINRLLMNIYAKYSAELRGTDALCLQAIIDFCKKETEGTQMKYYEKVFTMINIHKASNLALSSVKKSFQKLFQDEYIVRTWGKYKTRSYYKLNIESDDETFSRELKLWDPPDEDSKTAQ